jgi:competence protein ComEC
MPITAAFVAGIAAAPRFYLTAGEQVFLLSVILLLAALLLRGGRTAQGLLVSLLGFFLSGTFLAAEEHHALPANHLERLSRQDRFLTDQPARFVGWARTPSVQRRFGEYFDFEPSEATQGGQAFAVQGTIRVYYFPQEGSSRRPPGPRSLDVVYGEPLALSLRNLRRPRNFLNPGSFDYEAYLRRQGIAFTGLVRADEITRLSGQGGSRWASAVFTLRSRLLGYLDQRFPSGQDQTDQGAILKAILLGDDNDLDLDTESDFQASGTYHVLVVSGLHVTALAAGLFWLLSLLRVPSIASTLLVAGAVVGYTAVAGSGIPVVRAALMVLLYLVARLVYRERALLNSIAAAALLLLVFNPSDLRDPSFQLTFLAVFVLASIAVPVIQWTTSPYRAALRDLDNPEKDLHLEPRQTQFRMDVRTLLNYCCDPARLNQRRWRWLRRGLQSAASGALAVLEGVVFVVFMQASFALVMAIYFHRVTWSGIAANLLVIPLTAVLIPAGFVVLAVSLISWPVASFGGAFLGGLVSVLQWITAWTASLTELTRRVPTPPLWLTAGFLALLVCMAILADRRSRWFWLATAGLLSLCFILTIAPYRPVLSGGKLEVTALDVGQGDALFVVFPEGKTMLVDAGGGPGMTEAFQRAGLDLGENVVSPYLWSRHIKTLDIVVATHADQDHIGGMRSLLSNFRVGELWVGPGDESKKLARTLQALSGKSIPVRYPSGGDSREIDRVETAVLWPPPDWSPRRKENNNSLILRLGYGRRHILLPGDVEATIERQLRKADAPLRSDVLKVSHHGSNTSTTSGFLEGVAAGFGLISVGPYARYGHPRRETLERLRLAGVRIYRTDHDGATTFLTDGNRIEVTTHRARLRPWPPF